MEAGSDHEGERCRLRESEQREHEREHGERRDEEHAPWLPAKHHHPAQDEPERGRGQHDAPRGRSAQVALRDGRTEDLDRAARDGVHDAELQDDRPEPGTRPEVTPAVVQLHQQGAAFDSKVPGQVHRADRNRGEPVGRGVDRNRPARARHGDQDPADRGAADGGCVPGQPQRRVRLTEHRQRNRLRHDSGAGGKEERR